MMKEKSCNCVENTIYKVSAIGGKSQHRKELQKMIDNIEEYSRKHNLELRIEWEG